MQVVGHGVTAQLFLQADERLLGGNYFQWVGMGIAKQILQVLLLKPYFGHDGTIFFVPVGLQNPYLFILAVCQVELCPIDTMMMGLEIARILRPNRAELTEHGAHHKGGGAQLTVCGHRRPLRQHQQGPQATDRSNKLLQ